MAALPESWAMVISPSVILSEAKDLKPLASGDEVLRCAQDDKKLTALEVADALLGVGLHAFLEVLGLARPVLLDQLSLSGSLGGIGEAAAHGLAGRQERQRRRFG